MYSAMRTPSTMIESFLRRSHDSPLIPALEFATGEVSYGQLALEAGQLASALARLDTRGGQLTAVLAEWSLSAYGGFIATQIAGHTFVPLNPAFPARVLARMQQISGARTFVVGREGIDVLCQLVEVCPDITTIILLENGQVPDALHGFQARGGTVVTRADLEAVDIARPPVTCPRGRPAYLMFTSGSAGAPKGVAISREAATTWLEAMQARYDLGPGDRASHITTLDFDCALLELLLPLSSGACVCVPDQSERFNLGSYLAGRRLSVWVSSPSTAVLMHRLGVLEAGLFPRLRYTIFGSEGLPVELALTWLRAAPNSIIDNVYGPTELTVCCTAYRIDPATVRALSDNDFVPIGQPLPGMRALVVDDDLHPVGPGEIGELLMTGPQLADGYWEAPDLTQQSFVKPPSEHEIFYRTRDRVRSPLDGRPLTFLGRLDDQFKINGIRVEPAEIEASVRRVTGSTAAVAVRWPAGAFSASGVVALVEAPEVEEAVVIERLKAELPRHMVPRRVIAVSPLPRTHRGKLDRRACLSLAAEHCSGAGRSSDAH
jgi:amino acid adenylation domain-containing protein